MNPSGKTRRFDSPIHGDRYEIDHPEAFPESIEASKDFQRCITFVVEGQYGGQMYKNFTGGWQSASHPKIPDNVTLCTLNVSFDGGISNETLWVLMNASISSRYYRTSSALLEESTRDVMRA